MQHFCLLLLHSVSLSLLGSHPKGLAIFIGVVLIGLFTETMQTLREILPAGTRTPVQPPRRRKREMVDQACEHCRKLKSKVNLREFTHANILRPLN